MALIDDLTAVIPEKELSRRRTLGVLSSAMLTAAAAGTAIRARLAHGAVRAVVSDSEPDQVP